MSTSKPVPPGGGGNNNGNGGNGGNGNVPNSYTRFIPREELGSFAAWNPQTFEKPPVTAEAAESGVRKSSFAERAAASGPSTIKPGSPVKASPTAAVKTEATPRPAAAKPAAAAKPNVTSIKRQPLVGGMPGEEAPLPPEPPAPAEPAPNVEELVDKARKEGYQDGYRNGLVALESYKQVQGAQLANHMNDQIGALASEFHQRLESLEQQLAGRIAGVALELARQVVRSELDQRPEAVLTVAEEALGVLLATARQVTVRLNPEDNAMAQGSLTEVLQARGARLMPDPGVTRGGCIVESDIAVVDASVEARWFRAAASMGSQTEWNGGHEMPYAPAETGDDSDLGEDTPAHGDHA